MVEQPDGPSIGKWTVDRQRKAIEAHELGQFQESGLLIDAMGRDDRIAAVRRDRRSGVLARNGDFAIHGTEDGKPTALSRDVESWWFDVLPDPVLGYLADMVVMAGFALARIRWDRTSVRRWAPMSIHPWHTSNVSWDDDVNRYVAHTTDGDMVVETDDANWLLLEADGFRSHMAGSVRMLGLPYVMRGFNWRDWSRYNERHGLPLLVIKEPSGYGRKQRDSFFNSVRRMGSTGIIRAPQPRMDAAGGQQPGYDVEFREAKVGGSRTFQDFRRDLDTSIAVGYLGQNLSTEVQGGSFAAAKTHINVRGDIRAGDIEVLSTQLRRQLIQRYGEFNVRNFDPKSAPWPTWDNGPTQTREERAKTLDQASRGIAVLAKTRHPIDFAKLYEELDIPVMEGAEFPDPDEQAAKKEGPIPPDDPDNPDGGTPDGKAGEGSVGSRVARARRPSRTVALASGAELPEDAGFVEGQDFADRLTLNATERAGEATASFRQALLQAVETAETLEQARQNLLDAYRDHGHPVDLADVVQRTANLSEVAGRAAADQGDGDDEDDEDTP